MIYEDFNVMLLDPVKYELADIRNKKNFKKGSMVKSNLSVFRKNRAKKHISTVKTGVLDMLIRNCFICLIILAVFSLFNLVGFNNVIENLREIAENRSLDGIFTNAEFM